MEANSEPESDNESVVGSYVSDTESLASDLGKESISSPQNQTSPLELDGTDEGDARSTIITSALGEATSLDGYTSNSGSSIANDDDYDDDEDEDEEDELQEKRLEQVRQEIFADNFHPECEMPNFSEVKLLCRIKRDKHGSPIDPNHTTLPFLTKFEKTRVLGLRAQQIDEGATAFVTVPRNIISGYEIAKMELEQKLLPFIIRRPLPNKKAEYWRLRDLEIVK